jgi:hypothetical protein
VRQPARRAFPQTRRRYHLRQVPDTLPAEDLARLLAWLETAPLPTTPFRLSPWQEIGNSANFYRALRAALAAGPGGPYWAGAVQNLRYLATLFGSPEVARIANIPPSELPGAVRPRPF